MMIIGIRKKRNVDDSNRYDGVLDGLTVQNADSGIVYKAILTNKYMAGHNHRPKYSTELLKKMDSPRTHLIRVWMNLKENFCTHCVRYCRNKSQEPHGGYYFACPM